MGFFQFLKQPDINQAVARFREMPHGILLDVRTPQEYRQGHIPDSINLPLQGLDNIDEIVDNVNDPIYVYCHSGARSRQAAAVLRSMGYENVSNIGGIAAYSGKVEY